MSRAIDLGGSWRLSGRAECEHCRHELTAQVPGAVHHDLMRAGLIPDPFYRDQAEQCQWVERWGWTFARSFDLPADWHSEWSVLEFDGLDTYATITLNGRMLGQADNMFIPHRFEVGRWLRPGRNELQVHFPPHHEMVADKPLGLYLSVFSADRVFSRKMQCGFGWDWVHRLVNVGIWRPVRLRSHHAARLDDVCVRTLRLEQGAAQLLVEVTGEVRTEPVIAQVTLLDPQGARVAHWSAALEKGRQQRQVTIAHPRLWWPRGQGEPALYRCVVELRHGQHVVDEREIFFGIRTVQIEQVPDDKGTGFTLVINGRRIFAKGGNWVPPDPFPGTIPARRYERLIRLATEGNCNMLRAWGGGIYEPDAFWDACDRLGIMVWQDFMMACAYYPEDRDSFMDQMRREADVIVRQLRHHPSLVLWCGDNEDGMNWSPQSQYPGKKLAEQVTGPAVQRHSPDVPFWPTSPFGGALNKSTESGDCHNSVSYDTDFLATDMRDYRQRIDALQGRFLSECVTMGAPPRASLLKFMNEQDLSDPSERMWHYHTKDNPCNDKIRHFHMLRDATHKLHGDDGTIDGRIARMEYLQYEFVRLTVESVRRRKFHASGLLFWMYNDCWPASGWSLVDYWGMPKAGYFAMRRAFAPLIASLHVHDGLADVWVCNDLPMPISGEVDLRVQPFDGRAIWQRCLPLEMGANESALVKSIPLQSLPALRDDVVLTCDLQAGSHWDRASYFAGIPAEMRLPTTTLHVHQTPGMLQIRSDHYARVVTLTGEVDVTDNYFDLLPGEVRTIAWKPLQLGATPGVSCWNGRALERSSSETDARAVVDEVPFELRSC